MFDFIWRYRPDDQRRLAKLVSRIARGDNNAFVRLYQIQAPVLAAQLRAAAVHPADAQAVVAGTFVEAWWLARFHQAPRTDVAQWIATIATRRAGERRPAGRHHDGDAPAGQGHDPDTTTRPDPFGAAHERTHHMIIAGLLKPGTHGGAPPRDTYP